MTKILVAYATMAGSTAEAAQVVAEEISKSGAQVDVLPLHDVKSLEAYDGVVVGGPMIMGWHRDAARFLKKHRSAFRKVPLAVFILAMSLTREESRASGADFAAGVQLCVDEKLPAAPKTPGKLTFKERYTRLSNYLRPVFNSVSPVKPVSIGVFGGRLEFGRLKWWAILFAALIIGAAPGDRRNWPAIRAWAVGLPERLGGLDPAAR